MHRTRSPFTRTLEAMRTPRPNWKHPAIAVLSMLLIPALAGSTSCRAEEKANALPETQAKREFLVELEQLWPVESHRRIQTTNLHFLFRTKSLDFGYLKFFAGLTASRARGTISLRTGSSEAGTLRTETFESTATGAGPVLAAQVELARSGKVSASLDGSAGVLLYNRDFPAGASRYEFMLRIGPTLSYRLSDGQDLSLTLRGMHVSNGQGFNTHNPEYNGIGVGVQFLGVF